MVKGRKSGNTEDPSPCRRNRMLCALNLCQDATLRGSKKLKLSLLPFDKIDIGIDHLSTDSGYDNHSCINFLFHRALNQANLSTNLLDEIILTEVVNQKPRSVGPHKLIPKKNRNKKIMPRNQEIQECE